MTSAFETDLDRNPANFQPLTPISYLQRAAAVFPDHTAIIHGSLRHSYATFYRRSRQLASALAKRGIGKGDTVSVMLSNTPPMLEAHHGVPMVKAVLHSLNTRLDAAIIAFQLDHAETSLLIVDREFSSVVAEALEIAKVRPLVVDYDDPDYGEDAPYPKGARIGDLDYEELVGEGDADFDWAMPDDEWDAISLNYTSGTTGNPKGVVYHHRGAALMAYSNTIHAGMPKHCVYLWTLPMFHCNGWCFPWTLAVQAGTHVCLRWVRPAALYDAIADHGVSHLCGAPIVMSTLLNATETEKRAFSQTVTFNTAAAPPPESVLAGMADAGFEVTHLYGLTETYGPAVVNEWHDGWNALDPAARTAKKARQGVRYAALEGLSVLDPETMQPVEADGETIGEVMFRGNIVMKGYLKNRAARRRPKPSPERLVPFRRSRRAAPGRLRAAKGPLQGHHHLGRREHLLDRGRGRALQTPGGRLLRRRRAPRRQMGRNAGRVRRTQTRQHGRRRRAGRPLPGASGAVQMPPHGGVRRDPEDLDRQDSEVQIARKREIPDRDRLICDAIGLRENPGKRGFRNLNQTFFGPLTNC